MSTRGAPLIVHKTPYICPSCRLGAQVRRLRAPDLHRNFRLNSFLVQDANPVLPISNQAHLGWSGRAAEIRPGRRDSILATLEERGLVNQIAGERNELDRMLAEQKAGVYVGIDPTASSLHVGHLLPLMALYWMYSYGLPAFSILGGATAKIGDPSGRTKARAAQSDSQQRRNLDNISEQLRALWSGAENELARNGLLGGENLYTQREMLNNDTWLEHTTVMEMMRRLLPGVRLGTMLGRDTVKTRMEGKGGMSLAEFLYPVIQAWDFWHLYSKKGVRVQIGGSDQFGNILAGMDAINFIRANHEETELQPDDSGTDTEQASRDKPWGFTVPLLTTASGSKFGKSAGNAVWLDPELTSPFDLYQFFLGTADDDVHRYLRLFTFEPLQSLQKLMEDHDISRSKRLAQHALALNVLRLVHGEEVAEKTRLEHSRLFQSVQGYSMASIRELAQQGLADLSSPPQRNPTGGNPDNVPSKTTPSTNMTLPRSRILNRAMSQVLLDAGLVSSRSQGSRLCASNGVYVGMMSDSGFKWRPFSELDCNDVGELVIDRDLLFLRVGKTKVRAIVVTSDDPEGINEGQDQARSS